MQENSCDVYCDEIHGQGEAVNYESLGHVVFAPIHVNEEYELESLFFYPYDNFVNSGTAIKYSISLDNGINWHLLQNNEIAQWIDTVIFPESFLYKRSLKLMAEFSAEDNQKSPILDDFFLMYRLKQGES